MDLILSVFCGIDLFGKGFESEGFCVEKAGDIIFGDDIRKQHFPKDRFDGLIGGSPCQDFSSARRSEPTGYGLEMLGEFCRVVKETNVEWFILENVSRVPNIEIEGYKIQRLALNANECESTQNRNRHFQFGSKKGFVLIPKREKRSIITHRCITASEGNKKDKRKFEDFVALQGLERDFDLPSFHRIGKYQAVGNGVNINVAKVIAKSVREATSMNNRRRFTLDKICPCGCGRLLTGKQKASTPNCRKILQKKRELSGINKQSSFTLQV